MCFTEIGDTQLRLLRMVEEIDDHAIILLDKTGDIQTWNRGAQKIKGYLAQEIIGQNFRLFYSEADRCSDLPTRLLKEAERAGKAYHEGWRFRQDGSQFWGSITITATHDEEGNVTGFAKITRDLTERMQAETTIRRHAQELESQNRELEQFVYIASHDLQEPLLNVNSFVELFQQEFAEQFDEMATMYLDIIKQSTERMQNLIKSLLDYSRLGRQKSATTVDCQRLMETLMQDLAMSVASAGAKVHFTNLPTLVAYPLELRQLFQNLISNALKFRSPGAAPEISISAQQDDNVWRFSVRDNGIGIDPAFKDKIFLIFQRLHTQDTYEGNGIGLAHCKKIIDIHGGHLRVDSMPGQGSTFSFTIPNTLKNQSDFPAWKSLSI